MVLPMWVSMYDVAEVIAFMEGWAETFGQAADEVILQALAFQRQRHGTLVGAVFATLLYALTVVSLPMLLDEDEVV